MHRDSAIAQVVLEGVPLPSRKALLLSYAREQDPPAGVLTALEGIPDGEYETLDDVGRAIADPQPNRGASRLATPKPESGAPPGREAYLDASAEPGWIRDKPTVLDYEEQLVREPADEPGGGVPSKGDTYEKPSG